MPRYVGSAVSLFLIVTLASCDKGFIIIDTSPPPVVMGECEIREYQRRTYKKGSCLDDWMLKIEELNELLEDRQNGD